MPRRPGDRSKAVTVGNARYRVWRSMRILRRFIVPDLIATAEAGESNVQRFVKALLLAGYLRVSKPKREGSKGGHPIYQLVRDSGPNPPRVRVDGTVFDPNTDTTYLQASFPDGGDS